MTPYTDTFTGPNVVHLERASLTKMYYIQGSLYQDSQARLLPQQLMEVVVVLQEVGQAAAREYYDPVCEWWRTAFSGHCQDWFDGLCVVNVKDRWMGILCLIFNFIRAKIEFQRQILCAITPTHVRTQIIRRVFHSEPRY